MPREDRFRITGTTDGREENGEKIPMLHDVSFDVDPTRVRIEMRGLGGGLTDAIDLRDPAVRRGFRKVKALQDRTAYQNRPITSYWKDKPAKKRKSAESPRGTLVTCPACKGIDVECAVCDGELVVSQRQADAWWDEYRGKLHGDALTMDPTT